MLVLLSLGLLAFLYCSCQHCIARLIKALMLVLELLSQYINFGFYPSHRGISHLKDFMIAFLGAARDEHMFSIDALQRIKAGTKPTKVCADIGLVGRSRPHIPTNCRYGIQYLIDCF